MLKCNKIYAKTWTTRSNEKINFYFTILSDRLKFAHKIQKCLMSNCVFFMQLNIYIYIFSQKCWKLTEIIVLKQVTSTGYNLVSKYIIIEKVVYSKWNTTSWNPWFSKFFVFSRIRDSKHTDTDRKKWIFCMWIFNQNKNSFKSNMYLKIVYICISLMKNW